MSAIVELQERIQNTVARIAEYEKAARLPNAPRSLLMGIRSLEKLQDEMEADFARLARQDELEVCRYRLLPPSEVRPRIDAIVNAWGRYQSLFSAVYNAIKYPANKRVKKKAAADTEFAFAFAYTGSIGVTLTLPTRSVTESFARDLDQTIGIIFEMTKSQNADSLRALVDRMGVPTLQRFSDWVDAHVAFGAGAGIQWEGPTEAVSPSIIVQLQEFKVLKDSLGNASEPEETEEIVVGILDGGSYQRRRFRMLLDNGSILEGHFSDAITPGHWAAFPRKYSAAIRRTRKMNLVTGKEQKGVFLVRLLQELPI